MLRFNVSDKANNDLFEIGYYTQNKFGTKQRNKYLDELSDKFQYLAEAPEHGMPKFFIRKNYFSYSVQKHIVFYKKYSYGVRIIRVLHQSIDHKKHLSEL